MSRPRIFQVHLDNPQMVYCNGQTITGSVYIENDIEVKIKGIHVRLKGTGFVRITKDESESEDYSTRETYIFGMGQDIDLPPGQLSYRFGIIIPENRPSSFEGKGAYVQYNVEVSIKRGFLKFDWDVLVPVSINSIVDIRSFSKSMTEFKKSDDKYICCLCCKDGPISAEVSIPKIGYIIGEKILISATIQNNSSNKIEKTYATLFMYLTYRGGMFSSKDVCEAISVVNDRPVEARSSLTWTDVPLVVPPTPPSGFPNSRIIDVKYYIEFTADPDAFMSFDLDIKIPIHIGNVEWDQPVVTQPGQNSMFRFEPGQPIPQEGFEVELQPRVNHDNWNLLNDSPPPPPIKYINWRCVRNNEGQKD